MPGKKPCLVYGAFLAALMSSLEAQSTGTWISAGSGDWSVAGNWQGGLVPDGAGAVADFSTLNITSQVTVSLNGSRTIGGFVADDTVGSTSWVLNPVGAGSALTLDNGVSQPFFSIKSGLVNPRFARLKAPLVGAQGFVKKQGVGTLWLDADNSSLLGGIRVEQGALRVTHPNALGADPVTFQISGGANVSTNWVRLELGEDLSDPENPTALTVANPINIGPYIGPSAGAIAVVDNTPNRVTTLTGDITVTGGGGTGGLFTGPTADGSRLEITGAVLAGDLNTGTLTQTIDRGYVRFSGGGSIPTWRNNGYLSLGDDNGLGGAVIQNGYARPATLDLNGYDLTLSSIVRTNRSAVVNTDLANQSVLTINTPAPGFSYNDTLSGNLSLVKTGAGTLTLGTTTSVISGVLTVDGSPIVNLIDSDTLGLAVGQTLLGTPINFSTTSGSTTASVVSATNLKVGMTVSGPNVPEGTYIAALTGTSVTLSSAATATGSLVPHHFSAFPAGAKIVSIDGLTKFTASELAEVSSAALVNGEQVITRFSSQVGSHLAYTGRTVLQEGVLSISTVSNPPAPGGLGTPPTAGPQHLVFEGGTLRYTGVDGTTNRGFTVSDAVTAKFEISASTTNLTFEGDGPVSTGGLEKTGAGQLTLKGDHHYQGPTNVAAGTLQVSGGGSLPDSSLITVRSAAKLIASGDLGPIQVDNGATIEVGPLPNGSLSTSAASLTTPRLTVKPQATMAFEFASGGGSAHDRLSVTEANGLDIQGGIFGAYVNGGSTPFAAAGTYPIIDYNVGFTGSLSSVFILGTAPGYTYALMDRPDTTDIVLVIAPIITRTWASTGGGAWTAGANWGGEEWPDTFGEGAILGTSITAPSAITLDSAIIMSSLTFNSTRGYSIDGAGSITFNGGSSAADIRTMTSAGSHLIDVPVSFAGPVRIATIANSTITFGKDITSSVPATLSGAGTVVFGGTAGFSSISVDGGTLQIGNGGESGSVSAPQIDVASGAKVVLNRSNDFAFSTNVKGSGASLIHVGTGTTTLGGSDNSYSTLDLRAGTVRLGSVNAVPNVGGVMSAALVMDGSATFDLNGFGLGLSGSWSGTGGILTDNSLVPGTTTFTYASLSTSTYKGVIADGPQRALALVKTQTSGLTLEGANSFSGGVTLRNGTLTAMHSSALGSGGVRLELQGGGSSGNFTRLALGGNVTLATPLTLGKAYANGTAVVSLAAGASASATVAGPISIQSGTSDGYTFYGGTFNGANTRYLVLSGAISAPGINLVTGESIKFAGPSGASVFDGLEHRRGTMVLGATGALPSALELSLANVGSATFDLNGYNQALAQVVRASATYTATVTNSNSATVSTLTLNPSVPVIFSGTFSGNLSLSKALGAADLTLTGVNTHTQETVVNSGRLIVSGAGRINSSRINLQNGAGLSLAGMTGTTAPSLGGGLAGYGTVDAANLDLRIGTSFDPANYLIITANSVTIDAAATTRHDINSTFVYDKFAVTGSLTNAGALVIDIGAGVSRNTGRTFTLAQASGGITPGFASVEVDGVAFAEDGDTGVWTGTVVEGSTNYVYSYDESAGVLSVTSGASSSLLDDWLEANIPDPEARTLDGDPDGDGLSNLLEYATRGDPMSSGPAVLAVNQTGGRLSITFNRRADDQLIYTVEGSNTLGADWSMVAPFNAVANPVAGLADDTVTVVDSELLSTVSRRFLRLKVDYGTAP